MSETLTLPPLREDVRLLPGPRRRDGSPSWTLHDRVRDRFFRIGWPAFEMLARWSEGTSTKLLERIGKETTLALDQSAVERFLVFLSRNNLTLAQGSAGITRLAEEQDRARRGPGSWLLHNYLFVRIPILKPNGFLHFTKDVVRPFYSKTFIFVMAALGLLSGVLILRQGSSFLAMAEQFTSFAGLLGVLLTLMVVKILHEFGHAYAAALQGCRVKSMGVALLVLFPVLYTDVTDAWRLTDRRGRLLIGAAGMGLELVLAVLASMLWLVLPDGALRGAAFLVAGLTWIMTLAVNLNPFMRFDGYYLLADALDMENLQPRAFAMARWWLRRLVLRAALPAPEAVTPGMARFLIVYAILTWIYRLFLFIGIALLVYHFAFKALGIFLFVVEIAWFIGLPLLREMRAWWDLRRLVRPGLRHGVMLGFLGSGVWLILTPFALPMELPAVYRPAPRVTLLTDRPGEVVALFVGEDDTVAADQPVLRLSDELLTAQQDMAKARAASLGKQVDQAVGRSDWTAQKAELLQRLAQEERSIAALETERAALTLRAPVAGIIDSMDQTLRPGVWVRAGQPVAQILGDLAPDVLAFADEAQALRIGAGQQGIFYPNDLHLPPVAVRLEKVEPMASRGLTEPVLASVHGGPIPARTDGEGRAVPLVTLYELHASPVQSTTLPDTMTVAGRIVLAGTPESLAARAWTRVRAVFIQESGF